MLLPIWVTFYAVGVFSLEKPVRSVSHCFMYREQRFNPSVFCAILIFAIVESTLTVGDERRFSELLYDDDE